MGQNRAVGKEDFSLGCAVVRFTGGAARSVSPLPFQRERLGKTGRRCPFLPYCPVVLYRGSGVDLSRYGCLWTEAAALVAVKTA